MRSNYKILGNYIRQVNMRDININVDRLLGVSIQKILIPSIANTIGTDMSTYKIIKKNQFAYGPVTSRNGDKVSIALLEDHEEAIVSQAYTVFEIIDTHQLLPEYLMMWFRRPEFDRYARFMSHGSAREIFDWEEMCNVALPIPNIEKQKEIVKEYNVLADRIRLNSQLIAKLEETAQAIYKQWFVDFEFPDENGKPYKSNGGEIVESELGQIPKGWEKGVLGDIVEITSGKTPVSKFDNKSELFKYPIFGAGGVMGYSLDYLFDNKLLSIGRVGTHGIVQRINYKCWASDNTLILTSNFYEYVYQILLNINYDEINRGGVQGLITQTDIKNTSIIVPSLSLLKIFEDNCSRMLFLSDNKKKEIDAINNLKNLLLSKLTIES